MSDNLKLAELLFPNVTDNPEMVEEKYPLRNCPEGAVVTRMAPSPTGFVHLGNLVQGLISEQASDIMIVAEHIKKMRSMLNEVLAENCGQALKQIEEDTDRNYWMNAKEAVEYGIVDRILIKKK